MIFLIFFPYNQQGPFKPPNILFYFDFNADDFTQKNYHCAAFKEKFCIEPGLWKWAWTVELQHSPGLEPK